MPRSRIYDLMEPRIPLPASGELTLAVPVRVMTLLYGGGVEAGEVDVNMPFRGASIRGHLRFWWRATRGAKFATPAELRSEEALIWGDTVKQSPVRVRLTDADAGARLQAATPDLRRPRLDLIRQQPAYALFPAQEGKDKIADVFKGGSFTLNLRAPRSCLDDVSAALWAWLTFGGIGARTRRGTGALFSGEYAARRPWADYLLACSAKYCTKGSGAAQWPLLRGARVVMGREPATWDVCWWQCIELLRTFRQPRLDPIRRPKWPEADEIRSIYRTGSASAHSEFPRSSIGLPIVFHFKDHWDPPDHMLTPTGKSDRLASPVILRPVAISEREAIPVLLALNAPPPPSDLLLKTKGRETKVTRGRDLIPDLIQYAADRWSSGNVVTL